MSRARRRWPLALALVAILGVAGALGVVLERRWVRLARPIAEIHLGKPFGVHLTSGFDFIDDDTLALWSEGRVQVWSLAGETAALTSEHSVAWIGTEKLVAVDRGLALSVDQSAHEIRIRALLDGRLVDRATFHGVTALDLIGVGSRHVALGLPESDPEEPEHRPRRIVVSALATGAVETIDMSGVNGTLNALEFGADDSRLDALVGDTWLAWSLPGGQRLVQRSLPDRSMGYATSDGRFALLERTELILCDPHDPAKDRRIPRLLEVPPGETGYWPLAVAADRVVSVGRDGAFWLVDLARDERPRRLHVRDDPGTLTGLQLSPSGERLALRRQARGAPGTLEVWNLPERDR